MSLIQSDPVPPSEQQPITYNPEALTLSLLGQTNSMTASRIGLHLPCIPACIDHYMTRIKHLLLGAGIPHSEQDLVEFRKVLGMRLEEGFRQSPYSTLQLEYETPNYPNRPGTIAFKLKIGVASASIEQQYQHWVATRQPPLFGSHPDAKTMAVIGEMEAGGSPLRVLDIGAGTGRNTLPIARRHHQVDAVELTPEFAAQIQQEAAKDALPVRVVQGNVLDRAALPLHPATYDVMLVVEVTSHLRSLDDLQGIFQRASEVLKPGGKLVCNIFLPLEGYEPTDWARGMSYVMWSTLFLREEVEQVTANLPLRLLSDESVFDYEKQNLPAEAWPPTGWFESWSQGKNIFAGVSDRPPVELRWLVFEREPVAGHTPAPEAVTVF